MARNKVKLAYIVNDAARRAAFRKRRKGLMKKVSELSTLCGVTACAIVYGPDDPQPQVWPEQPDVHRTLMRFKSLSLLEQTSRQFNQEDFLKKRIGKMAAQYSKLRQQNRYMEINQIYNLAMDGTCSIPVHDDSDIVDLLWLLDEKKKEVQRKLLGLKVAPTLPNILTPNTSSDVFTTPPDANTADLIFNNNVNYVGVANGSGINGGPMTVGYMYGGVVNHYSHGGVTYNGTGTSTPQPDDQMVNYLAANTSSDVFTTPDATDANTIVIPNASIADFINANINVGVVNGSGITGVTGGGVYGGFVNHYSQGGVNFNGTGTSIPQSDGQTVNYFYEGNQNNNSQMMGGRVPPPSYNGGTGTSAYIFDNNSVGGGGVPTTSYNGGTGTYANIFDKNNAQGGGVPTTSYNGVAGTYANIFDKKNARGGIVPPPSYNGIADTWAEIFNNNSAGGGGVPPYNEGKGTLEDIININNNSTTWMMPANNSYVPTNNM
ncbi:hypothetical protein MKW94_027134 [Papaver nudicaule]|uniref:MADS-box domain-containing protein n=1 Tax=Papaver nudicaule TaxID=74823 RepID=A0AA41VMH2_PAPNU|nr:hypothetical protein [Papaver nudicaule]